MEIDEQIYPGSVASVSSSIVRCHTWSDDITKAWDIPVSIIESIEERAQRYSVYFTVNEDQLKFLLQKFMQQLALGMELQKQHDKPGNAKWDASVCSLKMMDTHIDEKLVLTGRETGSAVALEFGCFNFQKASAMKIDLLGHNKLSVASESSCDLRCDFKNLPKGLLDKSATATQLFDAVVGVYKNLVSKIAVSAAAAAVEGKEDLADDPASSKDVLVGFAAGFPLDQRSLKCASLVHWVKGFETGRQTEDPVEGGDVGSLLDCAFTRARINARTAIVLNDTSGLLVACNYEKPPGLPACKMAILLGEAINGCFMVPEANRKSCYKGCIVNCELGGYDAGLPLTDVDLEVDFADTATQGTQLLEKMVAWGYLGEICRRLILKIWQSEAPPLAWVRYAMPWTACVKIINDEVDADLTLTGKILRSLWDWETTPKQRLLVRNLCRIVFQRSAALSAVAIVAVAHQTDRLQPAMGGLTCALGGALMFNQFPAYVAFIKSYIQQLLGPCLANLIHLYEVLDGAAKGAAILAFGVGSMERKSK